MTGFLQHKLAKIIGGFHLLDILCCTHTTMQQRQQPHYMKQAQKQTNQQIRLLSLGHTVITCSARERSSGESVCFSCLIVVSCVVSECVDVLCAVLCTVCKVRHAFSKISAACSMSIFWTAAVHSCVCVCVFVCVYVCVCVWWWCGEVSQKVVCLL